MKRKFITIISCTLLLLVATGAMLMAAEVTETEPNDTPGNANPITQYDTVLGAVDPVGDVDYFSLAGVNTTWGFIALLDTTNTSDSNSATLDALGTDGSTVLQSDTGSWENGSGIALQNYADDGATHYLRVTCF